MYFFLLNALLTFYGLFQSVKWFLIGKHEIKYFSCILQFIGIDFSEANVGFNNNFIGSKSLMNILGVQFDSKLF